MSPLAIVTASGTPLGAIQATGGPEGGVVVVMALSVVVVVGREVEGASSVVVEVEVGVGRTARPLQAVARRSTASRPGRGFIGPQLWHGFGANRRILNRVFGPLNGVRTALVIAAVLAAIVSFFAGYAAAGLVLLFGVAIHGAGWIYLYSKRDETRAD